IDKNSDYIKTDEVKRHWRDFTENSQARKGEGDKEIRRIKQQFAKERAAIFDEYQHDKQRIKAAHLSRQDRIYQTALSVRHKMGRLESLSEEQSNTISALKNSIKPFGESEVKTMKNLQAWEERNMEKSREKDLHDSDFESHDAAIRPSADFNSLDSVKRNMENASHNAQAVAKSGTDVLGAKKPSINDLGVKKSDHGADFTHNNQVIFRDHGNYISTSKETSQDMAELTLSYAVNRYGSQLDIKGTDDFKEKIVKSAFEKDLKVEFSDKGMNDKLQSMRTLQREDTDKMDKISEAVKSANKMEPMSEEYYGNDDVESAYNETIGEKMDSFSAHEEDSIKKADDLRQNMLTESARHRGRSLLPAGTLIVSSNAASDVYETNLSAKVMADKEELNFIENQRENGNNVSKNPNLQPNIEKGEQLLNDFKSHKSEDNKMQGEVDRSEMSMQQVEEKIKGINDSSGQKSKEGQKENQKDKDFGMD
ncbi:MAG: hypothetical protein HLX50_18190, partial [Alteromonadaceae bacterium]|nr:hypothetical protein [Alteromonadaceae bacterium]